MKIVHTIFLGKNIEGITGGCMGKAIIKFILFINALCYVMSVSAAEVAASPVQLAPRGKWVPIHKDGLHDPKNYRLKLLQSPGDSLSLLPPDLDGSNRVMDVGNQVRWVQALEQGYINPRTSLDSRDESKMKILDLNVLISKRNSGELKRVIFPHKQHTMWLDCNNCHEWLFKSKAGANKISMYAVLNGEFCGRCHGAVAFPLTQCVRCHSLPFSVDIPALSTTDELLAAKKRAGVE